MKLPEALKGPDVLFVQRYISANFGCLKLDTGVNLKVSPKSLPQHVPFNTD
jgi:hypothetical protein